MNPQLIIRTLQPKDYEIILGIYKQYVEDSTISFEYSLPNLEDWKKRIEHITQTYPWLVAEFNGEIVGYAYASQHRERIAYTWATEVSVYVSEEFHGQQIAKSLYLKLFQILNYQGFVLAIAVLTYPNPRSERFHEKLGFETIGHFKNAGFKQNKWLDTKWMQLQIAELSIPPRQISPFSKCQFDRQIQEIFDF